MVVCCAHDDAPGLRDALSTLRDDGHEVELVEGLETDPKRLVEVIDRRAGEGLYVLCRSPTLDRERVEELREILLAQHIPFARTLTVAIGGRGALVDRIRSSLRRASARGGTSHPSPSHRPLPSKAASAPARSRATSRPGPASVVPINTTEDEEPTLVGRRDSAQLPITLPSPEPPTAVSPASKPPASLPAPPAPPPSSPAAPPPSASAASSASDAELARSPDEEDSSMVVEDLRLSPTSLADLDSVDPDFATEGSNASLPGATAADLDLSDLDDSIKRPAPPPPVDTTAVSTPSPLITGNTVVGPAPAQITGDTVVGAKLPELALKLGGMSWPMRGSGSPRLADADTEATTQPLARRRSAQSPSGILSSPAPSPPPAGPLGALAPLPADLPSAPTTAPTPMGTPTVSPSPSADDPGASRRVLAMVFGGLAALVLVAATAIALWPDGDDAESLAAREADADAQREAAARAKARAEAEARRKANEPPPPPPEYPVVNALEARKVRALDVLLIASDPSTPSDFSSAIRYCEELDIEGLRGWRLPHVGELSSISQANMIGRRGYFWSSTAADTFGDDHLAWNVKRGYAQPYDKDAAAVCVRGGVSGS